MVHCIRCYLLKSFLGDFAFHESDKTTLWDVFLILHSSCTCMLGFMCAFGHFTTPFQLYRDYLYYLSRKARKLYLSDSVSGETHGLI